MITVTATQAARNFANILDKVERGETIVITRDGVPVGRLAPERRTSAERLKAALRDNPADEGFADDLEAAHAGLRAAFTDEVRGWPGELSSTPVPSSRSSAASSMSTRSWAQTTPPSPQSPLWNCSS